MIFKKPIGFGLARAIESRAVCTVELENNLQISGTVSKVISRNNDVDYIQFVGPTQLAHSYNQILDHGGDYHSNGYGTPIGKIERLDKSLNKLNTKDLDQLGICKNIYTNLRFSSGVEVKGKVIDLNYIDNVLSIVCLEDCMVTLGSEILFEPSWGNFDLVCSESIVSVCGGPADINSYLKFMPEMAENNRESNKKNIDKSLDKLYLTVANERDKQTVDMNKLEKIYYQSIERYPQHWLILFEILEIIIDVDCTLKEKIKDHLEASIPPKSDLYRAIQRGLKVLYT